MNPDPQSSSRDRALRWVGIAVAAGLLAVITLKTAPDQPQDSLFFLNYWGPWCVALLSGGMLCLVAVFGKIQSKSLARSSGLLGVAVIAAIGWIGWGRSSAWITPPGLGQNFSLSYLRQQLPALPEALYDGGWASPAILRELTLARVQYPA